MQLAPLYSYSASNYSQVTFGGDSFYSCDSCTPEENWRAGLAQGFHRVPLLPPASFGFIVGNASAVIAKANTPSYDHGTIHSILSATKWITSTILIALVEGNELSLTLPMSAYLDYWSTDPTDFRSDVTLQHLLHFTSGFSNSFAIGCINKAGISFYSCSKLIYENLWGSGLIRQGSVVNVADLKPGDIFQYDSCHLEIAMAAAEIASGKSVFELYDAVIAAKLGLPAANIIFAHNHPDMSSSAHMSGDSYATFMIALTSSLGGSNVLFSAESAELFLQPGVKVCNRSLDIGRDLPSYLNLARTGCASEPKPYSYFAEQISYGAGHFINRVGGKVYTNTQHSGGCYRSSYGYLGFSPQVLLARDWTGVPSLGMNDVWMILSQELPFPMDYYTGHYMNGIPDPGSGSWLSSVEVFMEAMRPIIIELVNDNTVHTTVEMRIEHEECHFHASCSCGAMAVNNDAITQEQCARGLSEDCPKGVFPKTCNNFFQTGSSLSYQIAFLSNLTRNPFSENVAIFYNELVIACSSKLGCSTETPAHSGPCNVKRNGSRCKDGGTCECRHAPKRKLLFSSLPTFCKCA